MNELKKALPILLAHFVVGLLGCFVWAFIKGVPVDVIAPFVGGYKLRLAFVQFVSLIPSLFVSGLLLGYSLSFGSFHDHHIGRFSKDLFSCLKGGFFLSFMVIAFYIVLAEGLSPFAQKSLVHYKVLSNDYTDDIDLAEQFFEKALYNEAELYAQAALTIWPKNTRASQLLNEIQYKAVSDVDVKDEKTNKNTDFINTRGDKLTVLSAISISEEYFAEEDFFSSHYYAMLAVRMALGTDPNKEVALRLASHAWNKITMMEDSPKQRFDSRLFTIKKQAYAAIQREDWLQAYYILSSLYDEQKKYTDNQYDPDVERLLGVAQKGLLGSYFFIDETTGLDLFEAGRNVFFYHKEKNGGSAVVFFKGITFKKESGKEIAYLRDFEYAFFNVYNQCVYKIFVPYVKMMPVKNQENKLVPQLLLHSVDRTHKGEEVVPLIIEGEMNTALKNILLLDMPYDDIQLILSANQGINSMSLANLLSFAKKAEDYGFSHVRIVEKIIQRLAMPFLMLILAIFTLVIAWKFRLSNNDLFKARWIVFIPFFPLLSWIAVELIKYLAGLCIIPVVAWSPNFALALSLGILAFSFVGASVYFFAQRGD